MAPAAFEKPTVAFSTLKREQLFRHPPRDKSAFPALIEAVKPHIDSFNALTKEGGLLDLAREDIGIKTTYDGKGPDILAGNRISLRVDKISIGTSKVSDRDKNSLKRDILPSECRERHSTYRGRLSVKLGIKVNDGKWITHDRECGNVPIMLRSNRCHLQGLSPYDLVERKEESEELGGYFIINGGEKLIRMLIMPRRNHPMAIVRPSFANRGASYTNMGVQIRCVRPDQTSQTNVLHYLHDGNVTFRFSWRKQEYLVPVVMILKALVETNDREIFDELVSLKDRENSFITDRVELLLRTYKAQQLYTQTETLQFLGDKFRVVMRVAPDMTDVEVGKYFLRKVVLVHLKDNRDKFRLMIFMVRKLYALAEGSCCPDNPDAVQHQETLLGGFLYGMILKEKIEEYLESILAEIRRQANAGNTIDFTSKDSRTKILSKVNENIGQAMDYFLATGNLASPTGLDMQQVSGFTVGAEKINFYRFISHFRCVHRGSFFAQLKTTTVRKLLPESWGFLCPVHTPDGSPCGLLNHLSHKCRITTSTSDTSGLMVALASLGAVSPDTCPRPLSATQCIQLDGKVVGWCSPKNAKVIAQTLRYWKVEGTHKIPLDLEIGYVPESHAGQYPGLYLFSQEARMIRPVKYLPLEKEDQVGPFEQPYMTIAVNEQEITPGETSHVEYDPTNILSIVANMTPFSDFNQSPRNMYQCQMGKQAMGTPGTAIASRTDNKSYRLQTGQTPIVRSPLYNAYGLDNFPNGMNAVVAVISYTGYDMDDAMIMSKSAHERGFGHGTVYKTAILGGWDRDKSRSSGPKSEKLFGFYNKVAVEQTVPELLNDKTLVGDARRRAFRELGVKEEWFNVVDFDGLPKPGAFVQKGDAVAIFHEIKSDGSAPVNRPYFYKGEAEDAYIEEVRLLANESPEKPMGTISVKYRIPRSPNIGDKFSSRHGQKGVLSQKWPTTDMPFSESGMQPDIIINPHAFPSRMTIGMFVESLAGKSGSLHGIPQDSTPFKFDENHTAADYFGEQLRLAGYNYHGNEPMYSGITGQELHADIYIGLVYYQRLRHMVNDKYQVRSTGPVAPLTHQPIKGRKKGGGIRVGEMERDSLLAHGAAFLLQDRLFNCSDYCTTTMCRDCGSFLSTMPTIRRWEGEKARARCRRCAKRATGFEEELRCWEDGEGVRWVGGENTTVVAVPYVLKYLDVELAAMGIGMKFNVAP
ncbi:beta and beta-prime subunits of DNA dependent RNA-polymerase [Ascodesmis nigricans]|uniref:DNA-directed RNA polymerase subunit beta n=1 Tax=Ascodesmis nigricans TaxID=341454 RepID=A0A4S2N187_9PEZI|nr:beta and beta-prime subunits of DNA dependent RNA-polymerase [Ascodesmis nigricans]